MQVALVLLAATLPGAIGRDLHEPDEGRYAEIAREMVATGDYLVPRLNTCRFYEKPPLTYWLTALCIKAFGARPFAARLPSILAALLLLIATIRHARGLGEPVAAWSGWIVATSPLVVALGQCVIPDTVFAALVALSLFDFEAARRGSRPAGLRAWLWLALATLAKGPLAPVLVGSVMLVVALLDRGRSIRPLLRPGPISLFLALVLPWFVFMAIHDSDFLDNYLLRNHFARALGSISAPNLHEEPFYYYAPWLLAALGPWSLLFLLSFHRDSRRPRERRFVLVAWALPLFLLSVVACKLPSYLLPILPPLSIFLAHSLVRRFPPSSRGELRLRRLRMAWAVLVVTASSLSPLWNERLSPQAVVRAILPTLQPGDEVACFSRAYPSVSFTLDRPVTLFGVGGDFHMAEVAPEKCPRVHGDRAEIAGVVADGRRWLIVIREYHAEELLELLPGARERVRRGRYVIYEFGGAGAAPARLNG